MAPMKRYCLVVLLLELSFFSLSGQDWDLALKLAPKDALLLADNVPVYPITIETPEAVRLYRFTARFPEVLKLSAPGYRDRLLRHPSLSGPLSRLRPRMDLQVKLEPRSSSLGFIGFIQTGSQPKSVLFVEGGRRIATALLDGSGIEVFDSSSFEAVASSSPALNDADRLGFVEMVELPERRELWVSQMTTGKIHIFETGAYRFKQSISAGGRWPKVLITDPSHSKVYVSHWTGRSVAEIDVATRRVLRTFSVDGIPRGMAISPDGEKLYIANFSDGNIEVVDLCTGEGHSIETGPGAMRHLVIDTAGRRLYFSDMYYGSVGSIDTRTERLLWRRRIGSNVNTIALDSQERCLYASVRGKNGPRGYLYAGDEFGSLVRLDARSGRVLDMVWGGNQPTGLDLSPDGSLLAFSDFLDHRLELYQVEENAP